MKSHQCLQIVTGLSVRIAGVLLVAVLDEEARTARIEQHAITERHGVIPSDGHEAAIVAARNLLARRVRRTRPDLKMIP